jgi:hypothetical protein
MLLSDATKDVLKLICAFAVGAGGRKCPTCAYVYHDADTCTLLWVDLLWVDPLWIDLLWVTLLRPALLRVTLLWAASWRVPQTWTLLALLRAAPRRVP